MCSAFLLSSSYMLRSHEHATKITSNPLAISQNLDFVSQRPRAEHTQTPGALWRRRGAGQQARCAVGVEIVLRPHHCLERHAEPPLPRCWCSCSMQRLGRSRYRHQDRVPTHATPLGVRRRPGRRRLLLRRHTRAASGGLCRALLLGSSERVLPSTHNGREGSDLRADVAKRW